MNGRQAARAAAVRIEELEYFNKRAAADITKYNECIADMIHHRSPCKYCEDYAECMEAGNDVTIGCDEWMLAHPVETP